MMNEQHDTLRQFLIIIISSLRPNPQSKALIRVDNAPGFLPLKGDVTLSSHNIHLDYGRIHNKNKNPVIEKGIRELGSEILRVQPEGGAITGEQLAVIVNQLNSRIRNRGLSAWEILCQRNQFTGEQLDLNDLVLSEQQAQQRVANQEYSSKHKARGNPPAQEADVVKGSLVYIKSDGDKTRGRDRYMVVEVDNGSCILQKFVKSQLRSKRYQMKLTEVYPVFPEIIEFSGKIRDLDDVEVVETEEESQQTVQAADNVRNFVPNTSNQYDVSSVPLEVPQSVEVSEPVDVLSSEPVVSRSEDVIVNPNSGDSAPTGEVPVVSVNPGVVRPRREVSKPAWMRSGDFELD